MNEYEKTNHLNHNSKTQGSRRPRPKSKFLAGGILFALLMMTVQGFSQVVPTGKERVKSVNAHFEKEVLRLTNLERKKRGLKPLKLNQSLAYSARYHAKDMAEDNYFNHDSYDRKKNGRMVKVCGTFQRIKAFEKFNYMAENISAGRQTPKSVLKAWMKSPGHKKNILGKNFTEIGIGYYYFGNSAYRHYWVQNFGGN